MTAQRRLRSASTNGLNNLNGPSTCSDENIAASNKQHVESEVEKIVYDKCNLNDPDEVNQFKIKLMSDLILIKIKVIIYFIFIILRFLIFVIG